MRNVTEYLLTDWSEVLEQGQEDFFSSDVKNFTFPYILCFSLRGTFEFHEPDWGEQVQLIGGDHT